MIKQLYRRFHSWMGYNPPGALSSKGWSLFRKEFKQRAPVRYWFQNDFRKSVILPIKWKYEAIIDWILYRTINRYHVVDTGLPPNYYGLSKTMLHVNFNLLKDFVEAEQAWASHRWIENEKWYLKLRIVRRIRKYRFRDPEAGIKSLEWASTLDDPNLPPHERCDHQAVAARETLALYYWWVKDRPARKSVEYPIFVKETASDETDDIFDFDHTTPEFKARMDEYYAEQSKLDELWDKEDDDMLIRLIKIRHGLWT